MFTGNRSIFKYNISYITALHQSPKMTTSYQIKYLFCLLLFLPALASTGQHLSLGSPEILNFSKTDYHAGTQNWSISQDQDGITYFGNNKGVLRFDGNHWNTFTIPNRTIVRSIAIDEKQKIYVGAQDELGYLTLDSIGMISYQSMIDLIPKTDRSFEDVWKIIPYQSKIFFCSRRAIFIFEDQKCTTIKPKGNFENIFQIGDRIFAQDLGHGLLEWNGPDFKLIPDGQLFEDSRVASILPNASGALIISELNGLFLMDEQGIKPWNTPANDFLKENRAYCALKMNDGRFAIGTAKNGLLILDESGNPQIHLNRNTGLQNNTVLSILQDRQQNFWLGLDNGIDYVKIAPPFSFISSEFGIEGTGYAAIVHQDKLYLGTNQGLYFKSWPLSQNPFATGGMQKINRLNSQIWSLNILDSTLIASTHKGAYQIDGQSVKLIQNTHGSWKFMPLIKHPGYAIEGTYSGLFLYQKQGQEWEFVRKIDGFDESARIIEQDLSGNIWVSHAYKGLFKIKLDGQLLEAKIQHYGAKDGLPTDIFITVAKVKEDVLFASPKGVFKYDEAQDRFERHEKFEEVLGGIFNINRLIEDQTGSIWFSVEDEFGVLEIDRQGFLEDPSITKRYFNQLQEQLVDGFEFIYAYDAQNVFISVENGFIHYNPVKGAARSLDFNTNIQRVYWFDQNEESQFSTSPKMHLDKQLELPNSLKNLRFTYSSPFVEHFQQIQFRYRLVGFEDEWSEWNVRTEKEFTNLPYGSYTFEVQSRNAYNHISEPDSIAFKIAAPWHTTKLAKGAFFILFGVLLGGVVFINRRRLEKEKAAIIEKQSLALQKKEAQYKEEQEESEAEIIRLRNENLRSDIRHKNAQLASATMHLVQKGEILLKIKKELKRLVDNASSENRRKIQQLIHTIDDDIRLDNSWDQFESFFDQVHENFLKNLRSRFPSLTPKDQKLCAYLRMNLTTKEIAPLMNISVRGVEISRYRLRKKLELDTEVNLVDFIMKL